MLYIEDYITYKKASGAMPRTLADYARILEYSLKLTRRRR